ncbi:hypothetical protein TWF718_009263 [Orbilia javanica]|uniref:BTB domain-containing protein n=1 Tax=Orbilia javanica TaxID=47235 RepID=A0AAN8RGW6_9PEZI
MSDTSKKALEDYIIDESGDVVATLCSEDNDAEISTLRLSSKVLSLVSPVFKAMLNPAKGFKESCVKKDGTKEIRVTAFSEKSTILAMNIFHYRPENLPQNNELSSLDLYQLAKFADYYQCQRVLEPWALIWAMPIWEKRCKSSTKYISRWLWIGISFRIPQIIKECAQEVFEHMKLEGGKFTIDEKPLHDAVSAKKVEIIWNQREKHIQQFIELVEAEYLNLKNKSKDKETVSKCNITQLGTLKLVRLKIALPNNGRDKMTFKEIFSMLRKVVKSGQCCHRNQDVGLCDTALKRVLEATTQHEAATIKDTVLSAFGISDD